MKQNSIQHEFLIDAIKTLSEMKFDVPGGGLSKSEMYPASLKNLIRTIRNVRTIQKVLHEIGNV